MKAQTFEMNISKMIEAPLEKVWNAWGNAETIKKWWGPEGFTAPVVKTDFKERGVSLVCMRSPDGFEIYNTWTYSKIVPMHSIEFVQHFTDKEGNRLKPSDIGLPPGIPFEVPHIIIFKELGNRQTDINIREYGYSSKEVAEISKSGMSSVLDKLAKVLEEG